MANEVSVRKETGIASYLTGDKVKANIVSVVGEKNSTKFISSIVSAVQTNPELAKCTNTSILSAALLGEALQLSPSPQLGQFYMVPYKNTKTNRSEAQFQLGAKGYKQLAIRSGQYRKLVTSAVKKGELKSFNPITEEIVFEPVTDMKQREMLPVIGYYAMFELVNGFRKEIYWSREKMEEHAKRYSKGYASDLKKHTAYTFWSKDFDGMAEKTMVRQLISKWGIMSIDMQKAFEGDMGVIDESGKITYVDNEAEDPKEVAAEEIRENANAEEFVDVTAQEVPTEEILGADGKPLFT